MKPMLLAALCLASFSTLCNAETLDYQFMCPTAEQVTNLIETNQKSLDVNTLDANYNKKSTAKFTYYVNQAYPKNPLPKIRFGYVYVYSNNNYAPTITCNYTLAENELLNNTVVEGNISYLPSNVSTIYLNTTPGGYGYSGRSCEGRQSDECKIRVYKK